MGAALALTMAFAQASAAEQQDDAFHVTAACDEERSRETARKLFEFMQRQFDPYRNTKPLEVKVLEETWADGRPPSFIHQAKFATFEAAYYLVPGGKRALQSLTTRSASFKLPAGIAMGQSETQVLHALGPPTAISTNAVLYEIGGEAIHDVLFTFEHGHLVQVSWAYGAAD
jgi:hypothetical protein